MYKRQVARLFAVHHVGGDRQDGLGGQGIAVSVELAQFFHEIADHAACYVVLSLIHISQGTLTKRGEGKLTLNLDNTGWNGDIAVQQGELVAQVANSLGSGAITVTDGMLTLATAEVQPGTRSSFSPATTILSTPSRPSSSMSPSIF